MNQPPLIKEVLIALVVATIVILVAGTVILMRLLRRKLAGGKELRPAVDSPEFQVRAYHSVIQRMKQQEAELKRLRQAEAQRATESENISQAVLSNLTSGVILFNHLGIVRQVNDAAKDLLGYASMIGLHARDVFRGASDLRMAGNGIEPPGSLPEAVSRALAGQVFGRLETEYVTPSGEKRALGVTLTPVRGLSSAGQYAVGLVSDLTEINRLSRQAQFREALLGERSAGIAHDFQNSLTAISGYAQILRDEHDPAIVQEFGEKIYSEASTLSRMIGDLLELAKPPEN